MLTTPIVYIVTPVVPIINLFTKSPVTPSSEQTVGQANPGAVCAVCTLRLPGVVERIRKRFGLVGNSPLEQPPPPPPPPLLNNLNKISIRMTRKHQQWLSWILARMHCKTLVTDMRTEVSQE